MLPPASVLGGQGGAPTSLQKGTVREAGANGLGVHRPPQSRLDRRRRSLETREATGSQPTKRPLSRPHLLFPPASSCPPCTRRLGNWNALVPLLATEVRDHKSRKNLPSSAGRKPGPSTTSPSAPVPGSPPHIARPFQQPAASTPSPHHPLSWLFVMPSLGEMSILFLCLTFGSVVCLPVEL